MAIETTYFPVLSNIENYYEHIRDYITPWFQKNATDYFDKIEFDESDNALKCYIGELAVMTILSINNTDYRFSIKIELPNGAKRGFYMYVNSLNYSTWIRSATKTSKGIGLSFRSNGEDYQTSFWITKHTKDIQL